MELEEEYTKLIQDLGKDNLKLEYFNKDLFNNAKGLDIEEIIKKL